MTDDRKNFLEKAREIMIANMWTIWILLFVSIILNINTNMKMFDLADSTAKKIEDSANKIAKGVILLDVMGRPIVSTPVNSYSANPVFKQAILGYIRLYGIYDWATLTSNYSYKIFTAEDLYKKNKRVKMFKDKFFLSGSPAQKDFNAYVTKLISLMNKNKLPESVSIVDEKITSFEVKNSLFFININFTVQAREYDQNTDKINLRSGHIIVRAIGEMDPSRGTPENPLGIIFTEKYEPTIIEKHIGSII